MSKAHCDEGMSVGFPMDIRMGYDLNSKRGQAMAWERIWLQEPKLVFMAPVCTAWSPLSNATPEPKRSLKREEAMPMVNFCVKVAKHQIKGKRLFILENPSASAMWSLPIMKALSDGTAGVTRVNTHLCCFGMVDPVSGLSMRKSISLLGNLPNELKEDVIKVCKRDLSLIHI